MATVFDDHEVGVVSRPAAASSDLDPEDPTVGEGAVALIFLASLMVLGFTLFGLLVK